MKISSPSDNPAGFYVANKFTTQIRGLEAVNQNIQTALSMLGLADDSIEEINDIMGEIRDIVSKSTSEYLTPEEREANQKKIKELFTQAQRIKENTEYSGKKLFSNTIQLDKNQTYYNNKSTTANSASAASFTPVTTAAGQTLNKIGDRQSSSTQNAPTENQPEIVTNTPTETPSELGDETINNGASISTMSLRSAAPAAATMSLSAPAPEDESDANGDTGVAMMSLPEETINTITFAASETQTLSVGGKTYTIKNTSTSTSQTLNWSLDVQTGQITFEGSYFDITAADGQEDNIKLTGASSSMKIYAGDMNDTIINDATGDSIYLYGGDGDDNITNNGSISAINGGVGDDNITNNGSARFIYGNAGNDSITNNGTIKNIFGDDFRPQNTDGNDTITNNGSASSTTGAGGTDILYQNSAASTTVSAYEKIISVNGANTLNMASGASTTVEIGGKTYTITNSLNSQNTISYTLDENTGKITFTGDFFTITAADGQDDNVELNGFNLTFQNSEGAINGTYETEDLGTSGTKTLDTSETVYVKINGMDYQIINKDSSSQQTLTYSADTVTGQISFEGSSFDITAANGQEDNIKLTGSSSNTRIYAGDMNDTIQNDATGDSIYLYGGAGDDSITNNGRISALYGDDGDDIITNTSKVSTIYGGAGNDSITHNSTAYAYIYGNEGDDDITNNGTVTYIYGNEGNDSITNNCYISRSIYGDNGSVTNDTDGNDTIINNDWIGEFIYGTGGDDNITNKGLVYYSINGNEGDDTLYQNSRTSVCVSTCENIVSVNGKNTFDVLSSESITVDIGGKKYTITNLTNSKNTISYTLDENTGKITFTGDSFTITAADGQEDNVELKGFNLTLQNSEGVIDGTYQAEDLGTSGSKTLSAGRSAYVKINGQDYKIVNTNRSVEKTLTYSTDTVTGQITFEGANLTITAANGQEDNIKLTGSISDTKIYAGDMNDTIVNDATGSGIYLYGGAGDDIITNTGSVTGSIYGNEGDDSITNDGTVSNIYSDDGTTTKATDGNDTVVNNGSVVDYIYGTGGDDNISNNGNVSNLNGGAGADIITNDGTVTNYLYGSAGDDSITNTGSVTSAIYGNEGDDRITNDGTVSNIYSDDGSVTNATDGNDTVVNNGSVKNYIYGTGGDDTLYLNSNTPININNDNGIENIVSLNGANTLNISSGWSGNVEIGGKKYTITNRSEYERTISYSLDEATGQITFEGSYFDITAADGQEDNIKLTGSSSNIKIYAGDMNDTITNDATGLGNYLYGGAGDDSITNDGTVTYIYSDDGSVTNATDGNDTVVNNGSVGYYIYGTGGDDSITNDGTISRIYGNEGNDSITNTGSVSQIYGNAGDDSITNDGTVSSTIYSDDGATTKATDGNDTVVNNGSVTSTIYGTGGDDSISNKGTTNNIYGGAGNDSITNDGTVSYIYSDDGSATKATDGNDTVVNNGSVKNSIYGTGGDDSITNSGSVSGNIYGAEGNDTLYKTQNATISGSVSDVETQIIILSTEGGSANFAGNETKKVQIADKIYTIENTSSTASDLTWAYNSTTGQITFEGNNFNVTAADGQQDNINWNIANGALAAGDGNDTVKLSSNASNSTINGGDGNDTLIDNSGNTTNTITNFEINDPGSDPNPPSPGGDDPEDWGSSGNTVNFAGNETKKVQIADKIYTIENTSSSASDLTWSYDNTTGQITFEGSYFDITAADGQEDNIKLTGSSSNTKIYAGDMNDTITNDATGLGNYLYGGAGDDIITNDGTVTSIYSDDGTVTNATDGNDTVINNGSIQYQIYGTGGDDSITNTGSVSSIYGNEGNDSISNNGTADWICGNAGNDSITNDGTVSSIYSDDGSVTNATDGNDTVVNNGSVKYSINGTGGDDNITNDGTVSYIYGNAGNDSISNNGTVSYIYSDDGTVTNATDGNDTVVNNGSVQYDIYGTGGTNTIYTTENSTISGSVSGFEPQIATDGKLDLAASETQNLTIDGKTYTIKNTSTSAKTLNWSYDEATGQITFEGSYFDITAADGQEDNIKLTGSSSNIKIYAGDMNDTITNDATGSGNDLYGGAGDDIITNTGSVSHIYGDDGTLANATDGNDTVINNGTVQYHIYGTGGDDNITNDGTVIYIRGGEGDDSISNKGNVSSIYGNEGDDSITNDGTVSSIYSDDGIVTNATDGNDTVVNNGSVKNSIYGTGGDDNITNDGTVSYIYGNEGNDSITNTGSVSNIYGDEGNDSITNNSDNSNIYGGDGNDTIKIKGDNNTINAGNGDDLINIRGNFNSIDGGDGNDYVAILSGKNNTVSGGTGYDKITNKGTDTTYSQMDELVGENSKFNILFNSVSGVNPTYTVTTGLPFLDFDIDVSSVESAISSLSQIDEIMLGLTSSRVDLGFQKNMLDSMLKTNLTRLSNLTNSRATLIDADTATEYNNLIAKAALISNAQLLQTQMQQNQASTILSLIKGIAS